MEFLLKNNHYSLFNRKDFNAAQYTSSIISEINTNKNPKYEQLTSDKEQLLIYINHFVMKQINLNQVVKLFNV